MASTQEGENLTKTEWFSRARVSAGCAGAHPPAEQPETLGNTPGVHRGDEVLLFGQQPRSLRTAFSRGWSILKRAISVCTKQETPVVSGARRPQEEQYRSYVFSVRDPDLPAFRARLTEVQLPTKVLTTGLLEQGKEVRVRFHLAMTTAQCDTLQGKLDEDHLCPTVDQPSAALVVRATGTDTP